MQRAILINGQTLPLRASANFLYYYCRARLRGEAEPDFAADLKQMADMRTLEGLSGLDETNALEMLGQSGLFEFAAIVRRLVWTFAYIANKNLSPFEEWSDALADYDMVEASRVAMELVNENFFLLLGVRAQAPAANT